MTLIHSWKLQLFGDLVLRREEAHIRHFSTEKAGLLLAYMAAFPTLIHTREALAEHFWPDSPPEAGRGSLRQALTSLRRILEPPDVPSGAVLVADRFQVRLNADMFHTDLMVWDRTRAQVHEATDLSERLHSLEEAARSYGGPFLPGTYMTWALEERQCRQEQYLEVLLLLTDAQTEHGDYQSASASAQRAQQIDPLQEEICERLMRLFALQGKPGLARRHYEKFCRLLSRELDLAPSPEVQALAARLDKIARNRVEPAGSSHVVPLRGVPDTGALRAPAVALRPRLPVQLTRFFGRREELHLLRAWLHTPDERLITITGIGGIGKTRLALESVQQETRFDAAITFVALNDLHDPERFLPTVFQALTLPSINPVDSLARLAAVVGAKPHLLILDGFEPIADGASATLLKLLEEVPPIACLITSRFALNLPGEQELALEPLPLPARDAAPQHLIANPTVQMLVDRMRARRPDFQVTGTNAAAVTALCARLEGIPLAVELAAGWARDLTVSQIQERLTHRFDLLISRQRGVPKRHHSLHAALESSYQLLPSPLQRFFLRLSIFRGGWREEMADIAAAPDYAEDNSEDDLEDDSKTEAKNEAKNESKNNPQSELENTPEDERYAAAQAGQLRILREHSLITVRESGTQMRYGMLETLRAFGQELLTPETVKDVAARHAVWFLEFAYRAAAHLRGAEQAYWLDRLEEEQDNLRAALEYGVSASPQLGLRLANALYWFWYVRGHFREGERWLSLLLARAGDAPASDRAWGLLAAGHLANCQSNNHVAVPRYEAARALFEQTGEAAGVAHALCRLGNAAQEMRHFETSQRLCGESVARFRALNDPSGLLLALFYYGNSVQGEMSPDFSHRMEPARIAFVEALRLAEILQDHRFLSLLQLCLCGMRRIDGNIAGALHGLLQALQWQRVLREPLPISYMLRELSYLTLLQGDYERASRLYGAMHGLRQRIGYPIASHEQNMMIELEAWLHAGIDAASYQQAFEAGQSLDFGQCLTLALDAAASSAPSSLS